MFADRSEAGRRLADRLVRFRDRNPVVVGLPRGGVPVALQVARALQAPLDVILVRKLGVPGQPELAMGAIGEDGIVVRNDNVLAMIDIDRDEFEAVEAAERAELDRRATRYRTVRRREPLEGRTVIVVDDGVATGATARAACGVARAHGADRVILAVPVAPRDWVIRFEDAADEYVAVETPVDFFGVGQFYDDFRPTADSEVERCLRSAIRDAPEP